ncbi:polyprenyl diphosphate synthase [Dehalococcoidia bacterium]|nr:polyprenyl diphosphate synthase [Dehalococcoidia bacterium]
MNNRCIPHHIALILDGNRRWAKERGLPSLKGHWQGYKNLIEFCEWCKNKGVKILTVFGFSTENWNRTEKEVNYLMKLFERSLSNKKNIAKFQRDEIKIKIIGQKQRLPESLQKAIVDIENLTKNNKNLRLNLAISYGGRWDIVQAVQKIISKKIPVEKITEDLITENLSTAGLPAPDLIIRSGGEKRLSNFVLWQAAYSELYFCKKYWPAFTEADLDKAIKEYGRRQRRFGK